MRVRWIAIGALVLGCSRPGAAPGPVPSEASTLGGASAGTSASDGGSASDRASPTMPTSDASVERDASAERDASDGGMGIHRDGSDSAASTPPAPKRTDPGARESARAPVLNARELRVYNIGMHIGGGPNDDVTKEPIHKSVSPHEGAIAKCFPTGAELPVDFGVDLVIEAKGGKAQVARPRTKLADDAFIQCVVGVFREIDFLPPRFGKTVVSYSLRFDKPKR